MNRLLLLAVMVGQVSFLGILINSAIKRGEPQAPSTSARCEWTWPGPMASRFGDAWVQPNDKFYWDRRKEGGCHIEDNPDAHEAVFRAYRLWRDGI
jgi:hypothetical protein